MISNILKIFKPKKKLENNFTSGKSFEEKENDIGAFEYFDEGFTFSYGDDHKTLNWNEITELNIYMYRPGGPFEEVAMEIVYKDKFFTITEAIPGWHQFVKRTRNVFPLIPKDWEFEVWEPSGETNYRKIYEK